MPTDAARPVSAKVLRIPFPGSCPQFSCVGVDIEQNGVGLLGVITCAPHVQAWDFLCDRVHMDAQERSWGFAGLPKYAQVKRRNPGWMGARPGRAKWRSATGQ
eukprot:3768954-Pyramimonas_sp.AAC.1